MRASPCRAVRWKNCLNWDKGTRGGFIDAWAKIQASVSLPGSHPDPVKPSSLQAPAQEQLCLYGAWQWGPAQQGGEREYQLLHKNPTDSQKPKRNLC